jgi:hypothetical protein
MILLGIDPGAPAKPTPANRTPIALHGWCLLDVQPDQRPVWVSAGHSEMAGLIDLIEHASDLDAVVVERPVRAHKMEANMPLLETALAAGEFYGRAAQMGRAAALLSAESWRACVAGSSSASDARVKTALGIHLPNLPKRSNPHERDAAGVALGWALRSGLLVGGRGRLTPPAAAAR